VEKCFLLKVDFSQCLDDFMTVHKIDNNDLDLSQLLNSSKHNFDRGIVYGRANLSHLPKFDFIANDLKVPVLSPRFVKISKLVNCEDFNLVPMILLDESFSGDYFSKNGNLIGEVNKLEGYYTLKFVIQRDYCNIEKSLFRKLKSQPNSLGIIKKIVLTLPKSGFPKMFKIKETISSLFVSESMKHILEASSIKGCLFEEIEVSDD